MSKKDSGVSCPMMSRKQHDKMRFDKNEEIPGYEPPKGEKESSAQSKNWEKASSSLGKQGDPRNGWTENHDGLHGSGEWIDNEVRYGNDYQVIKSTLPENRDKDESLGASLKKKKESKKK